MFTTLFGYEAYIGYKVGMREQKLMSGSYKAHVTGGNLYTSTLAIAFSLLDCHMPHIVPDICQPLQYIRRIVCGRHSLVVIDLFSALHNNKDKWCVY